MSYNSDYLGELDNIIIGRSSQMSKKPQILCSHYLWGHISLYDGGRGWHFLFEMRAHYYPLSHSLRDESGQVTMMRGSAFISWV